MSFEKKTKDKLEILIHIFHGSNLLILEKCFQSKNHVQSEYLEMNAVPIIKHDAQSNL